MKETTEKLGIEENKIKKIKEEIKKLINKQINLLSIHNIKDKNLLNIKKIIKEDNLSEIQIINLMSFIKKEARKEEAKQKIMKLIEEEDGFELMRLLINDNFEKFKKEITTNKKYVELKTLAVTDILNEEEEIETIIDEEYLEIFFEIAKNTKKIKYKKAMAIITRLIRENKEFVKLIKEGKLNEKEIKENYKEIKELILKNNKSENITIEEILNIAKKELEIYEKYMKKSYEELRKELEKSYKIKKDKNIIIDYKNINQELEKQEKNKLIKERIQDKLSVLFAYELIKAEISENELIENFKEETEILLEIESALGFILWEELFHLKDTEENNRKIKYLQGITIKISELKEDMKKQQELEEKEYYKGREIWF